jgi:hypothetical protein
MAKKNSLFRKSNGRNQTRRNAGSAGLEKPDVNEETTNSEEGDGMPSVFACPECHGVLWEFKDGKILRFRCRVGHSFGTESLGKGVSMASETALWAAVRALEEKAALQRRLADGIGERSMSYRLLDQSSADAANARLIRDMIFRGDGEVQLEEFEDKKKGASEARKMAKTA